MSVGMPGYNATASDIAAASGTSPAAPGDSTVQVTSTAQITSTGPQMMMTAAGDATLPEQVAYVPMAKPGTGFPITVPAGAEAIVGQTPQPLQQPAQTAAATDDAAQKIAAADAGVTAPKPTTAAPATPATNEVYVTAAAPQQVDAPKKGFLASLFSTAPASAAPAPLINSRSGEQPAVAAQPKAAPAQAAPAQAAPTPAQIDRNGVLILIRSALIALDQGNKTGNYTVLRDLGAPGFQTNTAARLAEIFVAQRKDNIDLSGVAVLEPQLNVLPQIEANGMLRMAGFFPSVPTQVNFELMYAPVNGQWRLFGISVSIGPSGPAAPEPPASLSAPKQPAPKSASSNVAKQPAAPDGTKAPSPVVKPAEGPQPK